VLKAIALEVIGEQRLFCEGCERRVEGLVKALEGVQQVRAQVRNQRIEVLLDAATLDVDTVAEHLGRVGYATKVVG